MINSYQDVNNTLSKRANWLKTRIESAKREGRFLSHDQLEHEALMWALELVEVACNGEQNESPV